MNEPRVSWLEFTKMLEANGWDVSFNPKPSFWKDGHKIIPSFCGHGWDLFQKGSLTAQHFDTAKEAVDYVEGLWSIPPFSGESICECG